PEEGPNAPIIESDLFSNSLTIIAKDLDFKRMEPIVQEVDRVATVTVRVIPVSSLNAEKLAEQLRRIYPQVSDSDLEVVEELPARNGRAVTATAPAPDEDIRPADDTHGQVTPPASGDPVKPPVLIAVDKVTNSLIVSGTTQELDTVEDLITQLSMGAQNAEEEFRWYKIEQADPEAVAATLNALFNPTAQARARARQPQQRQPRQSNNGDDDDDRPQARQRQPQPQPQPTPRIAVVADARTRHVIVRAKPTELDMIDGIVKQLDQVTTVVTEVRTFPLKNTDATEVAENLRELFRISSTPSTSRGRPRPPNLARAQAVRQMLELEGPDGPVQVDAGSMVAVAANRTTNSIVVSAPADAMTVIAGIVQELDQSAGESTRPVVRLYPVGGGDLDSLAQTIQTIFADAAVTRGPRDGGRSADQRQRTPVIVTADQAAQVLIVSASADRHELIATVLHDVREAQAAAGEAAVRVYKIRHADATQIANAVQGTFDTASTPTRRGDRRGGAPAAAGATLRVTADASSNSVVISATAEEHERIATIITEMDTTPGGESLVRAIGLDHADAEATAKVLARVFAPDQRGRRSAGAAVVIEGNRESRTLLVRADNDTFERIRAMAEQLDSAGSQAAGVFILPLTRAKAAQMAERVRDLHDQQVASARRTGATVERIAVTADERANALVLACTDEQFEQVSQWVNQIEEMNPRRGEPRVIKLEHADPEEVEQAIRQLFGGSAPPRRGQGGDDTLPFEMTVLPNQRQLLIEASDEDYEMVLQLVESLDTAAAAARPEMRLFVLEHANPSRVAQSFNQMFQRVARGRAEDAVTITALDQTNSIVVAGTAERIADAARLIEQLDTEMVSPEVQFKIYPLAHARPSKVIGLLDTMLEEYRRANPNQPIGLVADEPTRSIVVTGRPKVFEEIEKILAAIDVEPATPATEVRIIPLLKAEAGPLAEVLNEMLRPSPEGQVTPEARALQEQVRRLKVVGPDGEPVPELDLTRPIKIDADPSDSGSNALIISSTGENVAALVAVVKIMDTVPISETVEVRIAHLQHADAASVLEVLREIFTEGAKQLAGRPGGPVEGRAEPTTQPGRGLVKPLNVSADPRTNTLVLSGAPDTLELAGRVITDLDQEASGVATAVRLFKLEHADAVRLGEVLEAVFAEEDGGDDPAAEGMRTHATRLVRTLPNGEQLATQFPRTRAALTVQPDEATNTLVIAARKDMMPLIADVIASMDIPGAGAMNGVRIFPLTHANAGTMASMLQDLFDKRYAAARTEDVERQKPIILPDPRTNCLLVVANESDSEGLTDLLAQLDVEPDNASVQLAVLGLAHNDAGVVGPMIEDIFDDRREAMTPQGAEPAPQDRVNVEVDALNNALIISASAENLELIRDLLAKVDVEPSAVEGIVRLYPLVNADAQRIAEVLESLVSDGLYKPGMTAAADNDMVEAREKVSIVADTRTNVLVVSASRENFAVIEKIIAQLDATDGYGLLGDVRLYTLKRAEAETLAETLREFFESKRAAEEDSGGSGRSLEVTIVPDARTNTLLVAGGRECFTKVEALIDRLDGDGEPRGSEPTVFPLRKARAADMVESITQLYESQGGLEKIGLSISADERTNAVIVSGGTADVERIGQIVDKLDAGNVTHVMEIRVIPLGQADATELADLLDETLTTAPKAPGGDDATRQAMMQFIRRLPGGKEVVSRALQEGVLITPDPRANALVVVAAADSMNLLTNLIEALDSVAAPAAQVRMFRLNNADAAQMATVLSELFRLEGTDGDPKAASYTLTTADGGAGNASVTMNTAAKASLTVTVDTRTNTLLLGGSEQYVEMAAEVIRELDTDPGLERVPVVYRLRNAKATDIEEAARQWLDDERQRIIDAMGGDPGAVPRLLEQEVSVVAVTNTTTVGDTSIETSNTLLIAASQRYLDTILSMIDQLDQPQPQVHISVIMAAVRLDDAMEVGVDWDVQMDFEWDTENLLNAATFLGTVGDTGFLNGGLNLAVTGGDVKFFLQALKSRGNLEVIARPTITAMDNHPALIDIVEKVPFLTNIRITDSGGVINSVDYEEVGVKLDVTPRISPDGFILMDVKPELSSQSGTSLDLGGGASSPIFSTRTASTTVSVRDGQSIVIGGLIDTSKDDIETKIPLLGDIPVVGHLFKRTVQEERRTEFLMILTPRIVHNDVEARNLTRREIGRTHLRPESLAPYNQALFGDEAQTDDGANPPATLDRGVAPRSIRVPSRRAESLGPHVTVIGGGR
ncbi:MAG: secretin N-terminal domain-containing protein, partial [Planctomycetota bacterium]